MTVPSHILRNPDTPAAVEEFEVVAFVRLVPLDVVGMGGADVEALDVRADSKVKTPWAEPSPDGGSACGRVRRLGKVRLTSIAAAGH